MALDRNPAELIELAHDYPINHPARMALLTEAIAVGVAFLVVKATESEAPDEADPAPGAVELDETVPAPPSTPRRRTKTKSPESPSPNAPQTP